MVKCTYNYIIILPTTLPHPCVVVMKSGNLNFLEPSGPLKACNGTDFTFVFGT